MEHFPYKNFTNSMDAQARWECEQEAREEDYRPSEEDRKREKRERDEHANTLLHWDEQLTFFENTIANSDFEYALQLISEFEERNPGIYGDSYIEWSTRLKELKDDALRGKNTLPLE